MFPTHPCERQGSPGEGGGGAPPGSHSPPGPPWVAPHPRGGRASRAERLPRVGTSWNVEGVTDMCSVLDMKMHARSTGVPGHLAYM